MSLAEDTLIVLDIGEGERAGATMIKAARPELSLVEFEVKPGGGVQPHYHKGHSDSFYILEGELEVHVGDEVVNAAPGMYVLAPPGVVHFFRNVRNTLVRVLNLHTPGGFAEYRLELETLHEKGIQPDQAFFERHDIFDV